MVLCVFPAHDNNVVILVSADLDGKYSGNGLYVQLRRFLTVYFPRLSLAFLVVHMFLVSLLTVSFDLVLQCIQRLEQFSVFLLYCNIVQEILFIFGTVVFSKVRPEFHKFLPFTKLSCIFRSLFSLAITLAGKMANVSQGVCKMRNDVIF